MWIIPVPWKDITFRPPNIIDASFLVPMNIGSLKTRSLILPQSNIALPEGYTVIHNQKNIISTLLLTQFLAISGVLPWLPGTCITFAVINFFIFRQTRRPGRLPQRNILTIRDRFRLRKRNGHPPAFPAFSPRE